VATSLFGGTAPAFNSWLIGATGNELMPAYVMMVACWLLLLNAGIAASLAWLGPRQP
jgi:hypothetical protein